MDMATPQKFQTTLFRVETYTLKNTDLLYQL